MSCVRTIYVRILATIEPRTHQQSQCNINNRDKPLQTLKSIKIHNQCREHDTHAQTNKTTSAPSYPPSNGRTCNATTDNPRFADIRARQTGTQPPLVSPFVTWCGHPSSCQPVISPCLSVFATVGDLADLPTDVNMIT